MDQVLLRPLPVKHPEQLVLLDQSGPQHGSIEGANAFSYPTFKDFRDRGSVFSGVLARYALGMSVAFHGQTDRAAGELVSGNYFDVLGIPALVGRTFSPSASLCHPSGHL